ncbi:SGNH/GDSL hydrolase family protein [Echinicola sediminis]
MKNNLISYSKPYLTILLLVFFGGCSPLTKQAGNTLYPTEKVVTPYHNEWTVNHYQSRIHSFKEAPLDFGDIVFIGNSITEQGRNWSEKFDMPHIKNRGIAGDVTDGVLARLDEIIHFQPKAVFLLIGTNDLSNLHQDQESRANIIYQHKIPSAKYVGKNILKIAKRLHEGSPDTKIYLQTVLPTSNEGKKKSILTVNGMIRKFQKKKYIEVIDLHQRFVDQEGLMNRKFSHDGTHLNDEGYQVWVEAEKDILKALN